MNKNIVKIIKDKISQHHELYRFPVKAELWEDIFDQAINGKDSNWNGGGHSVGADVVSEGKDKTRYQNKSGDINLNKNTIKWNGHRTTSHKTIDEKIDFISKSHYDKYVMLGRNKKDICFSGLNSLIEFSAARNAALYPLSSPSKQIIISSKN